MNKILFIKNNFNSSKYKSLYKQAKSNFDPSVGIIDTSKWLANGNANNQASASINSATFMQQQQQQNVNNNSSNSMSMNGGQKPNISNSDQWSANAPNSFSSQQVTNRVRNNHILFPTIQIQKIKFTQNTNQAEAFIPQLLNSNYQKYQKIACYCYYVCLQTLCVVK